MLRDPKENFLLRLREANTNVDFSVSTVLQVILALGLLNVWLLRANSATAYRGGASRSLKEEFATYGLPSWSFYGVGAMKIGAALALLIGIRVPMLVFPAAAGIVVLMLGALIVHAKVKDPPMRSLPAFLMLVMSATLTFLNRP